MSAPKFSKGFTLIELLVVIAIIAILSVIGITVFSSVQKNARDAKRRGDLHAIALALEQYFQRNTNNYTIGTTGSCSGPWASPFSEPTWGVAGNSTGTCGSSLKNGLGSYFAGGNVPQDPFCSGTTCSSGQLDYYLSASTNFTISANLETAPSPAMTGCQAGYNYCVKNQQ